MGFGFSILVFILLCVNFIALSITSLLRILPMFLNGVMKAKDWIAKVFSSKKNVQITVKED
jgi:hypothetical protein